MVPKILLTLALTGICSAAATAQSIGPSAIDAAGASITAGGNTYEYAVGQVISSNTFTSASLVITPGVLQPNSSTTGVSGISIRSSELQIFPNPSAQTIFLQPSFGVSGKLQWALYAADGKLIRRGAAGLISGREQQAIDLTTAAAGNYFLQVDWISAGTQATSAFKIQKLD